MFYVDPRIHARFVMLPTELKNTVLERNAKLNTLEDLIKCLEDIVAEG